MLGIDNASRIYHLDLNDKHLIELKQMCAASADENGFVMSYNEAYNLVKETYSGSMQVTEDLIIGKLDRTFTMVKELG
jgi:hypothetical protein